MKASEERLREGDLTDQEEDEEADRLKKLGFAAFDHEASDIGIDALNWADEEFQKLGYELERLGEYPVEFYRVVKKE